MDNQRLYCLNKMVLKGEWICGFEYLNQPQVGYWFWRMIVGDILQKREFNQLIPLSVRGIFEIGIIQTLNTSILPSVRGAWWWLGVGVSNFISLWVGAGTVGCLE